MHERPTVKPILHTEVDVEEPLRLVGETGTTVKHSRRRRRRLIAFQQGLISERSPPIGLCKNTSKVKIEK